MRFWYFQRGLNFPCGLKSFHGYGGFLRLVKIFVGRRVEIFLRGLRFFRGIGIFSGVGVDVFPGELKDF